jgi:uncharacterized protein YdeI (YjbR/CyaY-like superfamily)
MPSRSPANPRRFRARSRAEWRAWLERHHATEPEVSLVYAKKHSGKPSVRYAEAVEEAICFGWIDTTVNRLDDDHYVQRFHAAHRLEELVEAQPREIRASRCGRPDDRRRTRERRLAESIRRLESNRKRVHDPGSEDPRGAASANRRSRPRKR